MIFFSCRKQHARAIDLTSLASTSPTTNKPVVTVVGDMSDNRKSFGLPPNWPQMPTDTGAPSSGSTRLDPVLEGSVADEDTFEYRQQQPVEEARGVGTATPAMSIPGSTATNPPMDADGRSQSAPCTTVRAEQVNWFATATSNDLFGFPPVAQQLAMNAAEATRILPDDATPPEGNTAVFKQANRPLLPGENLFEAVNPIDDWRRFHNLLGGFIPNPGTEDRPPPTWNKEPAGQDPVSEPEVRDDGAFRPYRRSRGGEGYRRRRRRGAGRGRGGRGGRGGLEGSRDQAPHDDVVAHRDSRMFEDTHLFYRG
ncbi:uncharacterized protein K460DRAFT_67227 [Cucurbitaria berberidis CBS 394.84]|uniref:Uncharacterized protein n=1 Tax=Cucurbitaria berberidis CBS 394.84 TaxID=1168544 RepID=A0A9P4LAG3_9PLEO|nr:uncharacterized protein K460DRAFT_67227 [Cucurbitaria berberidis CBS 394.84]KAF1848030.1 hypothetical protein K460DRAFT_67227 [Cucurbitaria berberidis CBS 394.84]